MEDRYSFSPVVVGIDGSRPGIDAALWAVDEAVSRDIPLRLVYAIDPADSASADCDVLARKLAAAEVAVKYAFAAVESTDKPVKIEVEILQDRPTRALLEASRWAALVCVGATVSNTAPKAGLAQPRRCWRHPPAPPWPSSTDTTRSMRNNSG